MFSNSAKAAGENSTFCGKVVCQIQQSFWVDAFQITARAQNASQDFTLIELLTR